MGHRVCFGFWADPPLLPYNIKNNEILIDMSLLPTELPASDTDSLAQDVARHSPEFARREAPATFTALAREDFADDVIDPLRLQSESGMSVEKEYHR